MPCQWKYSIKLYKSELKNSCQSEWIYVLYTVPDQNEYMYLLYTVPDHNEYMYCTLSRIRMNVCTVHCPGSGWIYVLYTVPDQNEYMYCTLSRIRMNPQHTVPVLKHGEFVLSERWVRQSPQCSAIAGCIGPKRTKGRFCITFWPRINKILKGNVA